MKRCGIQILSFNRPEYLKTTLESLYKVIDIHQDIVCVIEQSDDLNLRNQCIDICKTFSNLHVFPLFKNFGQRGATNLLFSNQFWDDCQYVMLSDHDNLFHAPIDTYISILDSYSDIWISTGYNSPEHDIERKRDDLILKSTCRAGHIVMRKSDFYDLMPSDEKAGQSSWFCGLICSPF